MAERPRKSTEAAKSESSPEVPEETWARRAVMEMMIEKMLRAQGDGGLRRESASDVQGTFDSSDDRGLLTRF